MESLAMDFACDSDADDSFFRPPVDDDRVMEIEIISNRCRRHNFIGVVSLGYEKNLHKL